MGTTWRPGLVALALAACARPADRPAPAADGAVADTLRPPVIWPLEEPWPKPAFTLTTTDGRPFDFRRETDGFATLLFFAYTHCPDVCPIHLAGIAGALKQMPLDEQARIRVVVVTADPARDSAAVLRAWLDNFDPRFIGLTGTQAAIDSAQAAARIPKARREYVPGRDSSQYLIGHWASVVAYSARDNQAHVLYRFGMRQGDWLPELRKLAREG